MKNLSTNQSHIIFSRMKEVWDGFLSIFDGDQYLATENETILTEELRSSLQNLDEKAKQYETNGILLDNANQKNVTKTKVKAKQPKIKKEQTNTMGELNKKTTNTIKDKNYELDR